MLRKLRSRSALIIGVALLVVAFGSLYWWYRQRNRVIIPPHRIAEGRIYEGPTTARAPAEEWPRWLGPRGDGISRETGLAETWPPGGPKRLWTAEVGIGYSSPVAAGGRVYLFSYDHGGESLTCFDAHSGRIVWNQKTDGAWSGSHPGTRATPVIDGSHIYSFGGAGDIIRRDLQQGAQQWRTNVLVATRSSNLRWGVASTPLIAGRLIYVQAGEGGPTCVAIDKESGAIVWQSEARTPAGYAHPILADVSGVRQLIVFGGNSLYGMDPLTGRTLWAHPWPTKEQVNSATPTYADGHLFVTSAEGQGSLILRLTPSATTVVWSSRDVQGYFQPAILDRGHLYLNSLGNIKCLQFPQGGTVWTASQPTLRLNYGGSLVRVGDKLLLMSARGKLSLAKATPGGISLLTQADVFEGTEIYATPLIYGGRLYAKGTSELVCFDLTDGTPDDLRPGPNDAGSRQSDVRRRRKRLTVDHATNVIVEQGGVQRKVQALPVEQLTIGQRAVRRPG